MRVTYAAIVTMTPVVSALPVKLRRSLSRPLCWAARGRRKQRVRVLVSLIVQWPTVWPHRTNERLDTSRPRKLHLQVCWCPSDRGTIVRATERATPSERRSIAATGEGRRGRSRGAETVTDVDAVAALFLHRSAPKRPPCWQTSADAGEAVSTSSSAGHSWGDSLAGERRFRRMSLSGTNGSASIRIQSSPARIRRYDRKRAPSRHSLSFRNPVCPETNPEPTSSSATTAAGLRYRS